MDGKSKDSRSTSRAARPSRLSKRKRAPSSKAEVSSDSEYRSVPSFLLKTYEIVESKRFDDTVSWSKAGDAFVIFKTNDFCERILPMYFKHKNLSSFVRQLNMYGFHKTKYKNNEQCFTHHLFQKADKSLLRMMKRKSRDAVSRTKQEEPQMVETDPTGIDLNEKITELEKTIKLQQEQIAQLFDANL